MEPAMIQTMRAAQLITYKGPLEVREVPVPEPHGEAVLVKVGGAGICHSDLRLIDGEPRRLPSLPFTLGHENAGWVARLGDAARWFHVGDPVAVFGGWSVNPDRFSRLGLEQLSDLSGWVGIGQPGGFAEYLLVPTYRYLLPLEGLDPVEAAPLTDAGLTPYRAVKKLLPRLSPGDTVVIIGVGGLGQFGVQYARALTPSCTVVAVDISDDKLAIAKSLGADVVLNSRAVGVVDAVRQLTDGEGAQGVIDFVGSDATLAQAAAMAGRQAKVVMVGLGGGTLHLDAGLTNEAEFTTSRWGSQAELAEVLALARRGVATARVQRFPMHRINDALAELRSGRVEGRAVLVPSDSAP